MPETKEIKTVFVQMTRGSPLIECTTIAFLEGIISELKETRQRLPKNAVLDRLSPGNHRLNREHLSRYGHEPAEGIEKLLGENKSKSAILVEANEKVLKVMQKTAAGALYKFSFKLLNTRETSIVIFPGDNTPTTKFAPASTSPPYMSVQGAPSEAASLTSPIGKPNRSDGIDPQNRSVNCKRAREDDDDDSECEEYTRAVRVRVDLESTSTYDPSPSPASSTTTTNTTTATTPRVHAGSSDTLTSETQDELLKNDLYESYKRGTIWEAVLADENTVDIFDDMDERRMSSMRNNIRNCSAQQNPSTSETPSTTLDTEPLQESDVTEQNYKPYGFVKKLDETLPAMLRLAGYQQQTTSESLFNSALSQK